MCVCVCVCVCLLVCMCLVDACVGDEFSRGLKRKRSDSGAEAGDSWSTTEAHKRPRGDETPEQMVLHELLCQSPKFVKDLASDQACRSEWVTTRWGDQYAGLVSVVGMLAKNLAPMDEALEGAWEVALSKLLYCAHDLPDAVQTFVQDIKNGILTRQFRFEWHAWLALQAGRKRFSSDCELLGATKRAIDTIMAFLHDDECLRCGNRFTKLLLCNWRRDGLVCKKAMCKQCSHSNTLDHGKYWYCSRHTASCVPSSSLPPTPAPLPSSSSSSWSSAKIEQARCWGESVCESDEIGIIIQDVWQGNLPPTKPGELDDFSFFVVLNALTNDWEHLPLQLPCASLRRGERNLKLMMRPYKSIWKQVINVARTARSSHLSKWKNLTMNQLRDRYQRVFLSPIVDTSLEDRLLSHASVIESLKKAHVRLIEELREVKGLEQIEHSIDRALKNHLSQQAMQVHQEPSQSIPKRAESVYQTIQSRVPILEDLLKRLRNTGRQALVRDLQELLADLRHPFETTETGTYHSFALLGETGCGKSFLIDMLLLLSRSNEELYSQQCKEIKAELERLASTDTGSVEMAVSLQPLSSSKASVEDPLGDIATTRFFQLGQEELRSLVDRFQKQEQLAQERLSNFDTAHEQYLFLLPAGLAVKSTTAVPIVIRRAEMYFVSVEYWSPAETASVLLQRAKASITKRDCSEQTQVLEAVGAILGQYDESDQYLATLAEEADRPGPQFEALVSALCKLLLLDSSTERNKPTSFVFFGSGLSALADRLFLRLVLRCTQGIVDNNPFASVGSFAAATLTTTTTTTTTTIAQFLHVTSFEGYQRAAELGARLLPALRKVVVRCPSRVAPANGQLVDLPGTNDPIDIRNQVRDRFLEHASFVAVLYDGKLKQDVLQCLTKTPVWRNVTLGQAHATSRMAIICNMEKANGAVSNQDLIEQCEARSQARRERAMEVQQILKRQVRVAAERERLSTIPHLGPTIRRFVGNVLNTGEVFNLELNRETDMYSVLGLLEFFFLDIIKRARLDALEKIDRVQRIALQLGSQAATPETRTRMSLTTMIKTWVKQVYDHAVEPFLQEIGNASGTLTGETLYAPTLMLVTRFEEALHLLLTRETIAPEKRDFLQHTMQLMVKQLKSQVERVLCLSTAELNRPLKIETCEELSLSPLAKLQFKVAGCTLFYRISSSRQQRRMFLRNFGKGLVEELAETCYKCITEEPEETMIAKELQQLASRIRELSSELCLDQTLGDDPASWVECGTRLTQAYRHERLLQASLEFHSTHMEYDRWLLRKAHKANASQCRQLDSFPSPVQSVEFGRISLHQDVSSAFDCWQRLLLKKSRDLLIPITCRLPSDICVQKVDDSRDDERDTPLFCRALLRSIIPKDVKNARRRASDHLRAKFRFSIATDAPQSVVEDWQLNDRDALAKQLALQGNGEELFSLTWLASTLKINVLVLVGKEKSIACWRLIGNAAEPHSGHVLACMPVNDGSFSLQKVNLVRQSERTRRSMRGAQPSVVDTNALDALIASSRATETAADALIKESVILDDSSENEALTALDESTDDTEDLGNDFLEHLFEQDQDALADSDIPSINELSRQQAMVRSALVEPFQRYHEQAMQGSTFSDLLSWRVRDPSIVELQLGTNASILSPITCKISDLHELVDRFSFFVDTGSCCERDPTNCRPFCEVRYRY